VFLNRSARMKFQKVYELLSRFRTPQNESVLFLLAEGTAREIYDCVVATDAKAPLELGTGYGTTTCIIAAALDEIGGGTVTTVDNIERNPISVNVLARHTGLSNYIEPVRGDYVEYLRRRRQQKPMPLIDFCFLDGAHEWDPDAVAAYFVGTLLRPGGWFVLDDLDFKLRGCQPDWEHVFADRSEEELDANQVRQVYDQVVCMRQDFGDFTVADGGRTGWARKVAGVATPWRPIGLVLLPIQLAWEQTYSAVEIARQSGLSPGLTLVQEGWALVVHARAVDPYFILPHDLGQGRSIDVVTLRLRLLKPNRETLQVYWRSVETQSFSEEQSVRVALELSNEWQEIMIRLNSIAERPIHGLRIDVTDGPSEILWGSLVVGGERTDLNSDDPGHQNSAAS
jgi:predicted O-methyltransferase YrrM